MDSHHCCQYYCCFLSLPFPAAVVFVFVVVVVAANVETFLHRVVLVIFDNVVITFDWQDFDLVVRSVVPYDDSIGATRLQYNNSWHVVQ